MEETTVFSVQEAYNIGYEDGLKTARTHTTQTRYVKDRTCSMKDNFDNVVCSACGEVMFDTAIRNYCPNCGARVVEVCE